MSYNKQNFVEGQVLKHTHLIAMEDGIQSAFQTYPSSNNFIGHNNLTPFNTDYSHIICYGQSLSNGSSSKYVTDPIVPNVYTLGTIASPGTTLTKLQLTSGNQHPIVSAANSLATLLQKYGNTKTKLIVGSYGAGGQSIAQLMSSARQAEIKAEEGYNYDCVSSKRYDVFTSAVSKLKSYAASKNATVNCPAIVFLQGERDYLDDTGLGFDIAQPNSSAAAYAAGANKDKYKLYMSRLKEDMQNEVMTAYGQTTKPLFCIYQVSGKFVKTTNMAINMAQLEFAEENDDVILIQSPYFTPQYSDSHLSTNGYRWLGEYIGKAIFETLVLSNESLPLLPAGFLIDNDKIKIKIKNCVLPLVIDTYTVEEATSCGFTIFINSANTTISNIQLYGDEIILTMPNVIDSSATVAISYAGNECSGTGNIRDSATSYMALYNYWDDSADKGASGNLTIPYKSLDKNGNSLAGSKYPMWNWLQSFYYQIQ